MSLFKPHMEILPAPQRQLWRELKPSVRLGLVLYGGTAIGLRLGHIARRSISIFSPISLFKALVYFEGGDLELLTKREREVLIGAAQKVRDLPSVSRVSELSIPENANGNTPGNSESQPLA